MRERLGANKLSSFPISEEYSLLNKYFSPSIKVTEEILMKMCISIHLTFTKVVNQNDCGTTMMLSSFNFLLYVFQAVPLLSVSKE